MKINRIFVSQVLALKIWFVNESKKEDRKIYGLSSFTEKQKLYENFTMEFYSLGILFQLNKLFECSCNTLWDKP